MNQETIRESHPSRRQVLRGAGIALTLPWLETHADLCRDACASNVQSPAPKRLLAICNNLGLLPDRFFPSAEGRDYESSLYLRPLEHLREDFTVFSGVSHPGVDGSHSSDVSFLTAAPHPGSGGFRNSISLDRLIARHIGARTRFGSLTLGVNAKQGRRSLSWTEGGVMIPCENSASAVYQQLFLQGSKRDVDLQIRRLTLGQSIMDTLAEQAASFTNRLSTSDRDRMDQFTTAVRDVETRMQQAQEWEQRAKPQPKAKMPVDPPDKSQYMAKTRLMYQMAQLAFETDSTRAITLLLDSNNSPTIRVEGAKISDGYHNLSHHGQSEQKLAQLESIDLQHMRLLADLLTQLKNANEKEACLLDHTMVMYGSNFGDANKHTTDNMPVLLAGGGFQHGKHLAFDRDHNYPLPNLFVSILQQMGIETDRFASSTGTMRGMSPT